MRLTRILTFLALGAAAAFTVHACTQSPVSATTGDRRGLLSSKTWWAESITFNSIDVTAEGSRSIDFRSDGTYRSTLHDGSTYGGTWDLSADERSIILDEGALEESIFELHELTATRLEMSWTGERDGATGVYRYRAIGRERE